MRHKRRGIAIIMVILVLSILAVVGLGMATVSSGNLAVTGAQLSSEQAYSAAEAGVARMVEEWSNNPSFDTSPGTLINEQLYSPGLSFTATFTKGPGTVTVSPGVTITVPSGQDYIQSTGTAQLGSGGTGRTVSRSVGSMALLLSGPFSQAISAGAGGISFDSTTVGLPPGTAGLRSAGSIVNDGTVNGPIQPNTPVSLKPIVWPAGSPSTAPNQGSGTYTLNAGGGVFLANTVDLGNGSTVTLQGPGTFYFSSLNLGDNNLLKIQGGPVHIFVVGAVSLHDNNTVAGIAGSTVDINAGGAITIHDNDTLGSVGPPAAGITLYAPTSTVSLHNNCSLVGAMAGQTTSMADSGTLTYPQALLSSSGASSGVVVTSHQRF